MEKEKNLLDEKNMNDVSGGWHYRDSADVYDLNRNEVNYLRNAGYTVDGLVNESHIMDENRGIYSSVHIWDANGRMLSYNDVRNLMRNAGFTEY